MARYRERRGVSERRIGTRHRETLPVPCPHETVGYPMCVLARVSAPSGRATITYHSARSINREDG